MTSCPSTDLLAALLDERLDAESLSSVEAHLEHCPPCQETLEVLTEERFSAAGWHDQGARESDRPGADEGAGSLPNGPAALDLGPHGEEDSRRDRLIFELSGRQPSTLHCSPRDEVARADGSSPPPPYPPEVEGYDIVGRLGRGGMGVVYRARHRGLDRLVALKMLRGGGHADTEALARFRIEVRAVARLRHPNVVQVHDVGESHGLPFVSLELLEGGSLDARNAGNPQPEAASATLVATLARAVGSAHAAGIVHRDLKPANILFSRDGVPKVTDFGLAKRLDEEDGQTQSGQVMGSPSFMAPEQARGEGREVGPPADIYSLGAILYEMVTGRPPFKGGSPLETLHQVIHREPINPSDLRPGLSRDLETICLKCLSKEPAKRYTAAADLAADLDRFLAGAPIAARRTSGLERGWKWAKREPAAALLALAGGLVVVGSVAAGLRAFDQAKHQRTAAIRLRTETARVVGQAAAAARDHRWAEGRGALNRLLGGLSGGPDLADLRHEAETLLARIERTEAAEARAAAARVNLDRFLRQTRLAHLAEAQWLVASHPADADPRPVRQAAEAALGLVGRFDGDSPGARQGWRPFAPAAGLSRADHDSVDLARHDLILLWAEATARPARDESRELQARLALAILDRSGRDGSGSGSKATASLRARLLADLGDRQAAEVARREAARLPALGTRDRLVSGREAAGRGDWAGAIAEYEAALQDDPSQFRAQLELAVAELRVGHPEAARAGFTACLRHEPKAISLLMLRGMANGQAASQRRRESREGPDGTARLDAERFFRAAEADFQTALDLHPGAREGGLLLMNRGLVRLQARHDRAAEADLAAAVERDPERLEARINWAQALRRLGRIDDAITQFTRAIALDPTQARLYRERALTRLDHQSGPIALATDPALADLNEAIRLGRPGSPEVADDYAYRAGVRHRAGEGRLALEDCDESLRIVPDHASSTLIRLQTLLDLKRYGEVVRNCDEAIRRRPDRAELWVLRGLARSFRQDFGAAVADFTQALTLEPTHPLARIKRGWAYLLADATKLAMADFDAVLDQDPENGEAHGCRGYGFALLGDYPAAIKDAEASLRESSQDDPRTFYNAARIYARSAAGLASSPPAKRPANAVALAAGYQDQAASLIQAAIDRLPPDRRSAFAREVVRTDPALAGLRLRTRFARTADPTDHPRP